MIVNNSGCALCNSTWGIYYETIEDTKLFFCCEICASLFTDIIRLVKENYNISSISEIMLQGNSRERTFRISSGKNNFQGKITFSNGKIKDFFNSSS